MYREEKETKKLLSSRHKGVPLVVVWVIILLVTLGTSWVCAYLDRSHPILLGDSLLLVGVALLAFWIVFAWDSYRKRGK